METMAKERYNPFVIGQYVSDEYFCDREKETEFLTKQIRNGRNVVMVSPRRIGAAVGQAARANYRHRQRG